MNNGETKWYQRIDFLIGLAIVIVGFCVGEYKLFIQPLYEIKTDVAVIKTEITGIKSSLDDHKSVSERDIEEIAVRIEKLENTIFK